MLRSFAVVLALCFTVSIGHADQPAPLKKQEAIHCKTERTIKLKRVVIDTKGVAVEVTGKCTVEITGSRIVGGKAALLVSGKGSIEVNDSVVVSRGDALKITSVGAININRSTVHGKRHAVRMTNRGSIYAQKTRFFGRKKLHHLSSYADDGKTSFKRWKAPAP